MTSYYSIKDLEKLSGIKAHTLRIWEKRYNVIVPKRTDTNIRYYNNEDLKKLLNIAILNQKGIKISAIAKLDNKTIKEKVFDISLQSNDHEISIDGLIVAMIDIDEEKFNGVLHACLLKNSFEKTITEVIYPFLEKIGLLWQVGSINPAQEHFITNLIRQKIIVAIDSLPSKVSKDKHFLLFLPENELHEISLLFVAYLIKKAGFRLTYLGQSVPLDDVAQVVRVLEPDCLFSIFTNPSSDKDLYEYLKTLSNISKKEIYITGNQIKDLSVKFSNNIIKIKDMKTFQNIIKTL